MEVYLVGGSVRDKLLGSKIKDYDYVVVGSTYEIMIQNGFQLVGKDFPVFINPETRDEYALARSGNKNGDGIFDFSTNVKLEDDLFHRDLTINAIAMKKNGEVIDPFGGVNDIKNKILRHVSYAYADDPIRVLRTARFLARYNDLGFEIAEETIEFMKAIVNEGKINNLTAERVWNETCKALSEPRPWLYFTTLRKCGALAILFPEINNLFGIPQTEKHHPEIDTGIHTLMVLEKACELTNDKVIKWAALLHDLGKGVTNPNEWPKHHNHEELGVNLVKELCDRWKIPNDYRDLAVRVCENHLYAHRSLEMKPSKIIRLFEKLDSFRKPYNLEGFLIASEADAKGRKNFENRAYPQAEYLRLAYKLAKEVSPTPLLEKGYTGESLGYQLRQLRIKAVANAKSLIKEEIPNINSLD